MCFSVFVFKCNLRFPSDRQRFLRFLIRKWKRCFRFKSDNLLVRSLKVRPFRGVSSYNLASKIFCFRLIFRPISRSIIFIHLRGVSLPRNSRKKTISSRGSKAIIRYSNYPRASFLRWISAFGSRPRFLLSWESAVPKSLVSPRRPCLFYRFFKRK